MGEYYVTWAIHIHADSPEEAAKMAREYQIKSGATAVVFDVTDAEGNITTVDLLEVVE